MVDRIDPDRIGILGGDNEDIAAFIESDFRIRSGMCPNGCGLLTPNEYGQCCEKCGFSCNTRAELKPQ